MSLIGKSRFVPAILFLTFAGQAFCAEDGLKMQVIYSETANLTYQLDAVSGTLTHMNPVNYQTLWKNEFLKTDQDQAMLKQWGDIKRRYQSVAQLPGEDMPFERGMNYISLNDNIRVAGLRAKTADDFLNGASLLMMPADVTRLKESFRYFVPKFHAWWQREAATKGQAFVKRLEALLKSDGTRKQIASFRKFYSPDLPEGSDVYFSLVYRPDLVKSPTSGQQMGSLGLIEFLPNEKPEKRLDVVVHEFCHFLYGARSEAANQVLQKRFVDSNDPAAKPAFNLLNEGMATALGNGVLGRDFADPKTWPAFLAKPNSLYNNPNIDRAGKKLLQLMDAWLPLGKTMDDPTFVPTYIAAMKNAFGPELTKPSLFLNEAFIYVDESFGVQFSRDLRQTLNVASAYTSVAGKIDSDSFQSYTAMPSLSAIIVVPPSQIGSLVDMKVLTPADGDALRNEITSKKAAVFATPRSPHAHTFVVVAETQAEANQRIKDLAAAPQMFKGILSP